MEHQDLAYASAALGAIGAPVLLLARERFGLLAGAAAVSAAELGLGYALVPGAVSSATGSAARLGLLAAGALAALALAAAFVRFPAAAPVALLVAAPFRFSAGLGGEQASLLLPLYVVLAAATAALVFRAVRGGTVPTAPLALAAPAAALVGLSGISLLWAHDPRAGSIELVFFYFPFAALFAVVARTALAAWSGRALAGALIGLTAILAVVGIVQSLTHTAFLAKEGVEYSNAYTSYFRVTSLFEDPNVYGRHLVLGIAVLLALVWLERVGLVLGLGLIALLAAGLHASYSQTSFAAVFAAVLAIGLLAGDRQTRVVLTTSVVVVGVVGAVLFVSLTDGTSARRVTSDRLPLARVTAPVYVKHPFVGVGVGSQPLASREEEGARRQKNRNVSHTTPLTVAAELGTVGLLAYLAFLAGLGWAILHAWRRNRALGLALAGCTVALVVHSIFYGAFFEDPFLWGTAALAAAAPSALPRPAPAPARRETARSFPAKPKPLPAPPPAYPDR